MPEIEEVEEEPVPGSAEDLERFYKKCGCSEEDALTAKELDWGWKFLGKEDGAALAHVITTNKKCITLQLYVNELFPEAGIQVAKALAVNKVLKTIDLQQAQIGPEGGKYIAEALKKHPALMNLKLHYNHLGPEGTAFIAAALKKNKKLTNLNLGDNGIMKEGVQALADMLTVNTCLMRLDLSKNAGLTSGTGSPETTAIITKAAEAHEKLRQAAPKQTAHDKLPFKLIMEDSPGQMWTPDGFVNVVKFPKQRRPNKAA
uniref:Uncharacterized protein n=1 Tax=Chrysotila carterae TaxID=13221 RepID=A0A7S4B7W9_CHRCT|mmetsp:Transcript_24556/g.53599  ORF Transcript_24556/g.53599 Transcript_24556/m.53599 type:complete len:259 (+) Transcript_24556:41-817(+)